MKTLTAWARLIRWPNLLIIALTQWVAWWTVIAPLSGLKVLTPGGFSLLCLSTVLIAAAGYIINDYFDIRIDVINKPDKVILERLIPRRAAIKVHWLFNGLALLLAGAVAIPAGQPEWLLLQLFCMSLLWRYSTTWKRQFMIGNVIVALMTALTIVALIVYEPAVRALWLLAPVYPAGPELLWRINPLYVLIVFAGFAFLLTWMREIVKDMEDYKGDDAEGCMTMPIRWGLLRSSRFVQLLCGIAIAWLAYCAIRIALLDFLDLDVVYVIGILLVPALIVWMLRLPRKATAAHYHTASRQLKIIMVLGILALFVYYL